MGNLLCFKKKSSGKKQDKASQERKSPCKKGKERGTLATREKRQNQNPEQKKLEQVGWTNPWRERVAMAEEEETEEAAVGKLKETMTKQDHSRAWGQHNTWLKKQPKEEQEAHAQKSKKEKGEAVVLWVLKAKVQRFQHHSQEVKGSSSFLSKRKVGVLEINSEAMVRRWTGRPSGKWSNLGKAVQKKPGYGNTVILKMKRRSERPPRASPRNKDRNTNQMRWWWRVRDYVAKQ